MQFANLVHHAMNSKITKLAAHLFLEYIDKHDVYHCLYERISTLTTYM